MDLADVPSQAQLFRCRGLSLVGRLRLLLTIPFASMAAAQNAERPIVTAVTVTPETAMPWTVIVQVLQKAAVKLSRDGKRFQNYVFADMEGTLINVVCFEQSIAAISRLLQPYQRYYVSNANIRDDRLDYKVGDYDYSWTVSTRTPIELIHDSVPHSVPCDFHFRRFSDLHCLIDHAEPIAIRGLIIHSYAVGDPAQANRPRDYIIVDEEKIPMIIRVWGDMLDNDLNQVSASLPHPTVVVLLNIRVTTYHGLSLGTKNNTCVLHCPPMAVATKLMEWYDKNSAAVNDMILEEAYKDTDILLPLPAPEEFIPISEVPAVIDVKKAVWVRGTVQLIPGQEKLWYNACQQCNKTIKDNITWEFRCNSCGLSAPGQPRCHVGVYLSENASSLRATLFSPDAEKLIHYTAIDLKKASEKDVSLLSEIDLHIRNKEVICFLKCLDKTFQGNSVRTYPVLKLYLKAEVASASGENVGAPAISEIGSSSHVVGPSADGTKEFFTPTLKNSLEDIEVVPGESTLAIQSNAVKRPLHFGGSGDHSCVGDAVGDGDHDGKDKQVVSRATVVAKKLTEDTATIAHVYAGDRQVGSTLQSPVKKTKSKED